MKRVGKHAADAAPGERWQKAITVARKQARRVDHYIEVRYEDLVAEHRDDAAADLRVRRAGLRPGDADLPRARRRAAARRSTAPCPRREDRVALAASERLAKHEMTTKPPERDRIFAWRGEMSEDDLATFEAVAGELLDELDYPVGDGARERATAAAEG